jgi:hypothetical protein
MIKIAQEKLLLFGMEIIEICRQVGTEPIVYGSLAYVVHTDDKIQMNDIDILVPEEYFPKIIAEVKKIPSADLQRNRLSFHDSFERRFES